MMKERTISQNFTGLSSPTNSSRYKTADFSQKLSQLKINIYNSFDSLPSTYQQFFKQIAEKNFFYSRAWLENIIDTTLESNSTLRLYGVETNDINSTPKALLVTTSAAQNGAKIKGWWVKDHAIAGLTNYQCHSHSFLYPNNTNNLNEIFDSLVNQFKGEKRPLIDLNLFASDSESLSALNQTFNKTQEYKALTYDYCSNWVENTEHLDYQQYLAHRSKSTRKSILRKKKRLQEKHDTHFEILTEENDTDKAISLFNKVYSNSWKEPEYFPDFTLGLIRTCAQKNTLRFGVLYIDNQPASVELCIVANNKAIFAKSAYDRKYAKHSVGSILLLHLIEHVIEADHSKLLSFGHFDDDYKKSWCQERRIVKGIVAFNTHTLWGNIGLTIYSLIDFKDSILQRVKNLIKNINSSTARYIHSQHTHLKDMSRAFKHQDKERTMKKTLIAFIFILGAIEIANANCNGSLAYGQYKQDCNHSDASNNSSTTEYTEIPYTANVKISKQKIREEKLANLEQSVTQAQATQSPFKPTHTQLDQVRQLLDYANSQGCKWGGKYEKPLLVCPE
ncbi:MAG: GNAT family N-acetyltransferase [Gammaproteobacteria bacterium]|nr:GNAT family N-acetyltransferase [Gammaproteobacteria bacterium]